MSRKLFTLDFEEDYNFLLTGIFCSYRDYRLCFELNRSFNLSLERQADLELRSDRKGSGSSFCLFSYTNEDEEQYFIIGNKGTKGHFVPELKQVDFFLMIRNQSRYTDPLKLRQELKAIQVISSVMSIEASGLKSADNFLIVESV